MIRPIVKRMDTVLTLPDTIVISQYSRGEALYIISKGECTVHVNQDAFQFTKKKKRAKKGQNGKTNDDRVKRLRPGYLFGDISLVYDCLCTATVQSSKYCNLGVLKKSKYEEVITIYPSIRKEIQEGIYEYDDKMLRFIKRSIKQVPYFQFLEQNDPCLYDIIYSLET